MEDITSSTHDIPVEDAVTGQTPGMEEEVPGQAQAQTQIQGQPASPGELVLEEEIEEELIIEDFTIDGICGVY
ncbi:MAG TPA: mycofactocin precursor MftA [Ktedonobacteraceae bacterium]|nr:mycofactocin precursor MftA [Ktedonobacteraceae bacterium]